MILGGRLGYWILRKLHPPGSEEKHCTGSTFINRDKLAVLLGPDLWDYIRDKTVIDFGCGEGNEAIALALHGARRVIGIDIRDNALARAALLAQQMGVADRCLFTKETNEKADVVVSVDSFEHFADPALMLGIMGKLLNADGKILVSFGPPWFHPYGGHLFSVFPWAHLLFTERSLIRWRSDIRSDGAKRFSEVEGGLNQMTINRFISIVEKSDFRFERLELVPIRHARWIHSRITREFLTSIVRCKIKKKDAVHPSSC
jgi:SAM-dependent methyltransferase